MSQKINPISFRIGLLQLWNVTASSYDKKINFFYLNQKHILEKYLKFLFAKTQIHIGNFVWVFKINKIFLLINCENSIIPKFEFQYIYNILARISEKIFSIPFQVYLIKHNSWSTSSELIKSYLVYSSTKSFSIKTILKNINTIICNQLGEKKLMYTIAGPTMLQLSGFKFKLSGRFDTSRNQMSKTIKHKNGVLFLSNLDVYTEYSHVHVYTKSGICGLGIWLTYVKQYDN